MSNQSGLPRREAGQAVLIILLSMAVVLTVVLSILGASTSDIKISTNETESLRAFSAAESGIEKALVANTAYSGSLGNVTINASLVDLGKGQSVFYYPSDLVSGDSAVVWFVAHAADGTLICDASHPCFTGKTMRICWGKNGTPRNLATTPAVELSLYYLATPGNYTTAKLAKITYDGNSSRTSTNSYSQADAGICATGSNQYAFQKQFDISSLGVPAASYGVENGLQFMQVKMLYNTNVPQPLAIDVNFGGNTTFPAQGTKVDSTGTLNTATRKIEVSKSYNQVPPIFDSAIFSPGGISQ